MHNSYLLSQVLLSFSDGFKQYREDLSAVLLTPEKHLWLGSDETSTIERLSLVDGDNFANHERYRVAEFIDLPAPEEKEIDIEGLAYTDYYLWLIGSHSYKRKKPKSDKSDEKNIERLATIDTEPNRYILGKIPLVEGKLFSSCPHPQNPDILLSAAKLEITPTGNLLMAALADDPHLGFFVKAAIPGKDNGFDVEGIAVCQKRVFIGLRGPVLRGWAVMLEVELEASTPGMMTLGKIAKERKLYKKHFLFLNGLGIRDMHLDGEDLLILAGPTMDLDGPVQLYRLRNAVNLRENTLHYPEFLQDIPYGNRVEHAEGFTLFENVTGIPSVLVVYDSPAKTRLFGDGGVMADVFRLG